MALPAIWLDFNLRSNRSRPASPPRDARAPQRATPRDQLPLCEEPIPSPTQQHDHEPVPPRFLADYKARCSSHWIRLSSRVVLHSRIILRAWQFTQTAPETAFHSKTNASRSDRLVRKFERGLKPRL